MPAIAFIAICGAGCGRYRDHVYPSRLVGHFVAYEKEHRTLPKTGDTLDLNENGSCVHTYIRPGETGRVEEPCTWTGDDKTDGTWLKFDGLSDGIHRQCSTHCVVEGAAWDGEFATGFDLPSSPDFMYVK